MGKRRVRCSGIEIDVFSIDLHEYDIRIQLLSFHGLRNEKIVAAICHPAAVRFKNPHPAPGEKQPGQLRTVAVAAFPKLLDVLGRFLLDSFFLLLGLFLTRRKYF